MILVSHLLLVACQQESRATHLLAFAQDLMRLQGKLSAKGTVWFGSRSQRLQYSIQTQGHSQTNSGCAIE